MQPEERDLIAGLFGRLKQFDSQPRDPEAERLIGTLGSSQPAAGYLLVQTVLVQEQALKAAQERITELEAKAGTAPVPASGFLASAPKVSPWGSAPTAAPSPTRSPLQAAVAPAAAPAAGGGFMRQAMATAAGVAGGALLFEGIRGMMGGHHAGAVGGSQAAFDPGTSTASDPDRRSPADLAQNEGAAEDYDVASNDSGSGGFDSGGSDDV